MATPQKEQAETELYFNQLIQNGNLVLATTTTTTTGNFSNLQVYNNEHEQSSRVNLPTLINGAKTTDDPYYRKPSYQGNNNITQSRGHTPVGNGGLR